MKGVLPLADGFEEIEANTSVDVMRRAGIDIIIAGLHDRLIDSAQGVKVMPDTTMDKISANDFDFIVLVGGYPGYINLKQDKNVLNLVREMDKAGKYIAAICGGPSVCNEAGILKGRKVTAHPSVTDDIPDAERVDKITVVDGNLITGRHPGAAFAFAVKVVEVLLGKDKAEEVSQKINPGFRASLTRI